MKTFASIPLLFVLSVVMKTVTGHRAVLEKENYETERRLGGKDWTTICAECCGSDTSACRCPVRNDESCKSWYGKTKNCKAIWDDKCANKC